MVVYDILNYMVFDNPVSKLLVKPILNGLASNTAAAPPAQVLQNQMPLWELAAKHAPIIRVAGICGASAVALGAYGSLMIVGTALFCGPCYYHAFTEDNRFGFLAPIGGTVLILSWLSMAL